MLKLADRVKETSITVGSGLEIVLAGAFGAFQTFSSTIGDGNSTYYTIENNSNFEVGVGTYNSSGNTLSRDLVLSSTNNNQRISLDGVSIVFCCYPASQAVLLDNGLINSPSPNYSGIVFPSSTVIDTALLSGVVSESILPTSVVYSNDSRLSDSRNPNPHTHPISDITALQSSLDSKQPTGSYAQSVHSHIISDVQGLQTALDNKQVAGSYAASSHSHTSSQITDFATAVSSVAPPTIDASLLTTGVLSDSRLSNNIVRTTDIRLSDARTPLFHNHNISDVSGLQIALDSKQASGNYAASSHTHIISSVSGLQSALDGKQASGSYAALSHTHTSSNITDFNSSVNGLISGIYAPLSSPTLTGVPLTPTASSGTNTNQIASTSFVRTEISNLVASAPSTLDTLNELATALGNDPNFATTITNNLAGKAALSGAIFTGTISSPSGSFTSSLKVNNTDVSLNGHSHSVSDISGLQTSLDGKQPSGSYAALSHNHSVADVTGLQTALDGKQPSGSYASSSHSHIISDVNGLQLALDGKQPSGSYAASSHNHTASQITDFNSSVSGLVNGIYAPINNPTFTGTINGTNLQINTITSKEQIAVVSTGVMQFGSKISKPSIYIHNIGDSSFATNSNIIGVQIVTNSNIEQNSAQYSRAFYGENKHLIASGVTNSGNSVAMQFAGMRNFSSSGDAGYLNGLYGIAIQYGHNILDSSVTPQTNNMYGLYIEPYNGYGTVNNSYDIFARPNAYLIEDYGVINNAYGIYIQGSHKKHLLEGKLGIGTNNPSYQLDVVGSGNFSQNLLINGTGVSISGHSHTSSNISNFNSSVSGLLPVIDIVAGTNITVFPVSGIYTINSTGGGSVSTNVTNSSNLYLWSNFR